MTNQEKIFLDRIGHIYELLIEEFAINNKSTALIKDSLDAIAEAVGEIHELYEEKYPEDDPIYPDEDADHILEIID